MAATTSETVPTATFGSSGTRQVELRPTRSTIAASRTALRALIQRDLVVLWKHKIEFTVRTLVQPFLLCFVFLYVFPKIGALAPADVDSAIVLNVVKPIWEKKTVTAGRVLNRIEQVLDYATSAGYRSGDNPARHVARSLPKRSTIAKPSSTRPSPSPQARDHPLTRGSSPDLVPAQDLRTG